MNILSLDPSYTRTGVFYKQETPAPIITDLMRFQTADNKDFFTTFSSPGAQTFFDCVCSSRKVFKYLKIFNPDIVIMEIPPPVAGFSAGLSILDSFIFQFFQSKGIPVYILYPIAINSYFGKRSISKSDIVAMAKERFPELPDIKINHDSISAYILYRIYLEYSMGKIIKPQLFKCINWEIFDGKN